MTMKEQVEWTLEEKLHEIDIELAALEERREELLRRRAVLAVEKGALPGREWLSEIQEARRK
jgi:hypothetical protein